MSIFGKQLAKTFGARVDVRAVQDPWGMGHTYGVRRSDHQRFQDWIASNREESPLIDAMYRAGLKAVLAAQLEEQERARKERAVRPGWRTPKKETKAESAAKGEASNPGNSTLDIVDRTVDHMDLSEVKRRARAGLNELKPGVALHLLAWWEGPANEDDGRPLECSLVNRLHFVGWDGVMIEEVGCVEWDEVASKTTGLHFISREAWREINAGNDLAKLVAGGKAVAHEFTGDPKDEEGRALYVDEDQAFGPGPVGDVIVRFLMDAGERGAEFRVREVGRDAEVLGATPGGGTEA